MRTDIDSFLKQKTSTFYLAIKLFPKDKRQAIKHLYFFLRNIDDIVDEKKDEQLFNAVKKDFFYASGSKKKSSYFFNQIAINLINKYQIPIAYFEDFFFAQEQDLKKKTIIKTSQDLDQYCYGVASVVGLMMNRILGLDKKFDIDAKRFGGFMQKVNILRDVREDEKNGRFYLPLTILKKFKVEKRQLLVNKNNYSSLIRYLSANWMKDLKKINFSRIKFSFRLPLLLAKNIYQRILDKIAKEPIKFYHERCRLNMIDWLEVFSQTLFYGSK